MTQGIRSTEAPIAVDPSATMRIRLYEHDRAPLEWGLAKISKMAENIVKMSTYLRIASPSAARHSAACERAKTFLAQVAESPNGFAGEHDVPNSVREVLYTSAVAWLRQVTDTIVPKQTELTIPHGEADKRRIQVENLRDRLEGVIGLFDGTADDENAGASVGGAASGEADGFGDGPEAHRPADGAAKVRPIRANG